MTTEKVAGTDVSGVEEDKDDALTDEDEERDDVGEIDKDAENDAGMDTESTIVTEFDDEPIFDAVGETVETNDCDSNTERVSEDCNEDEGTLVNDADVDVDAKLDNEVCSDIDAGTERVAHEDKDIATEADSGELDGLSVS